MLYRSLNGESCLNAEGAAENERKLVRILANRLRMKRDLAAHPEILDTPITAPIFICGMPRTGSTKLQKVLAASGDFNWIPFWQSRNPASFTGQPNEDLTARIADTDAYVRWFDRESPETKTGHAFETHEPDEESWILEHSFHTLVYQGWSATWGYLDWLLTTRDMTIQFAYLKDTLKYLQWQGLQDPAKRWVLKCPLYVGLEETLLKVFPDACLLMTHRSPMQTAPSICKLTVCHYKPHTDAPPDFESAINGFSAMMRRHLDYRAEHPDTRILDIYYEDMIYRESETLDRIYKFCGAPLKADSLAGMLDWTRNNPQNKHGKFEYSLEQFKLTPETINALFGPYNRFISNLTAPA
jgi:hypothetical protein